MGLPSPFEVGRAIGNQGARGFAQAKDENLIEKIISQTQNDPEAMQNAIGTILSQVSPERQPAAVNYLQNAYASARERQKEGKQRQAAIEAGISPDLPAALQVKQYESNLENKRMQQYGLTPQGEQPQENQGMPSQSQNAPQANNPLARFSIGQLQQMTGDKSKAISEPAKQEIIRRREEEKLNKSLYETEADKLEAKRVAELADEIEKEYHSAKEEDLRLNRQIQLDKDGKLSTPAMVKLLDVFGLPIGILSNPATEEFRKIESDFVRNVSKVFPGGKITNYEISSYMKTIPGLMNSPEGRKAIIRNRQLLNQAKQVRYDAYKKIIKDNNGKKPQNLGILVEEATADKIAKIEEEFVSGMQEQIEKFQTPIKMIDPEGNQVNIPPHLIEAAMKAGARFG